MSLSDGQNKENSGKHSGTEMSESKQTSLQLPLSEISPVC